MYEPDPRTIAAAAAGSADAFAELVNGLQVPVWRFLTHLTADRALAEDLTQETFLRVFRKLDGFEGRSKFSTWVFQIARNLGIDALRRRDRRDLLPIRIGPVDRASPGPEGQVTVDVLLGGLDPALREAIVMIEVLGLTYREVGTVVGIPEGTAKSRVFRARQELVRQLSDREGAREM